jgi:hypothetical protein
MGFMFEFNFAKEPSVCEFSNCPEASRRQSLTNVRGRNKSLTLAHFLRTLRSRRGTAVTASRYGVMIGQLLNSFWA